MVVACLSTSRGRDNSLKKLRLELKQMTREGKLFVACLSRKSCLPGLADYVHYLLHKGVNILELTGDIFAPIFLQGGKNLQVGCRGQLTAAMMRQPRQSTCREEETYLVHSFSGLCSVIRPCCVVVWDKANHEPWCLGSK